jgi:hypothetical protein
MLRRVALVRTDVSEELSASIIKVTRTGGLVQIQLPESCFPVFNSWRWTKSRIPVILNILQCWSPRFPILVCVVGNWVDNAVVLKRPEDTQGSFFITIVNTMQCPSCTHAQCVMAAISQTFRKPRKKREETIRTKQTPVRAFRLLVLPTVMKISL